MSFSDGKKKRKSFFCFFCFFIYSLQLHSYKLVSVLSPSRFNLFFTFIVMYTSRFLCFFLFYCWEMFLKKRSSCDLCYIFLFTVTYAQMNRVRSSLMLNCDVSFEKQNSDWIWICFTWLCLITVCLDGTLPGYHLHRGHGSGANSWLIQLEV